MYFTILHIYYLGLEKTVAVLERENKALRKKRGLDCRCQAHCQAHARPGDAGPGDAGPGGAGPGGAGPGGAAQGGAVPGGEHGGQGQ